MLVIPAIGRLRQEDCEFKVSLGYIHNEALNTKEKGDVSRMDEWKDRCHRTCPCKRNQKPASFFPGSRRLQTDTRCGRRVSRRMKDALTGPQRSHQEELKMTLCGR
jgi:hypothetical protein